MATKKQPSKKVRLNNLLNKLKQHKFIAFLVLVTLFLVGFLIFRACVNHYNISLLDKAEAKMRAMNVPKADHTIYRRSCSFRSVKFQSAGSPICHIQRINVYDVNNDKGIAAIKLKDYLTSVNSSDARLSYNELKDKLSEKSEYSIDINNYVKGLECSHYISFTSVLPRTVNNAIAFNLDYHYLVISANCSRRFMFQTYPELN